MGKKQSHYIQLELILFIIAFFVVSIISIHNAMQLGQYTENYVLKQILYYGIGIAAAVAIQFIDMDVLYKSSIYLHIMGALSLIILSITPVRFAKPINGAKSWFNNDFPGPTIQPSEFAKITLIIFLAAIIVHHKKKHKESTMLLDFWLVGKLLLATIVPAAFILPQTDLGTTVVYFFITGVLIILSGINWKVLGLLVGGGVAAISGALLLIIKFPDFAVEVLKIKKYQIRRVMTWFDPTQQVSDDRYHIDLSLQTVGSGQITGKGMNSAEVFLPEAHTDFIFSIIGESFGFLGAAGVIFLFFLLIYRLVTLGLKVFDTNPFGSYICFGFMALILIHTFQNIGMTIGIMPITGIPLLFISYGGSTILSTLIGYGLVYLIAVDHSKQKDFLF